MKIKNIKDVDSFFQVLDKCEGHVELITSEGDRLNLKSRLSQYVALSKIFSDAVIDNIEIIASEPQDVNRIYQFILRDQI